MPYCLPTVKPFASNACAQISAMILDSGKSAEPTMIDLRSPETAPPPSGLELPHAAVGNDRRIRHADTAAGVHPAEHRLHHHPLLRLGVESAGGSGDFAGRRLWWLADSRGRHCPYRSTPPGGEEEPQGDRLAAVK